MSRQRPKKHEIEQAKKAARQQRREQRLQKKATRNAARFERRAT
jgi:hypothetical protein